MIFTEHNVRFKVKSESVDLYSVLGSEEYNMCAELFRYAFVRLKLV